MKQLFRIRLILLFVILVLVIGSSLAITSVSSKKMCRDNPSSSGSCTSSDGFYDATDKVWFYWKEYGVTHNGCIHMHHTHTETQPDGDTYTGETHSFSECDGNWDYYSWEWSWWGTNGPEDDAWRPGSYNVEYLAEDKKDNTHKHFYFDFTIKGLTISNAATCKSVGENYCNENSGHYKVTDTVYNFYRAWWVFHDENADLTVSYHIHTPWGETWYYDDKNYYVGGDYEYFWNWKSFSPPGGKWTPGNYRVDYEVTDNRISYDQTFKIPFTIDEPDCSYLAGCSSGVLKTNCRYDSGAGDCMCDSYTQPDNGWYCKNNGAMEKRNYTGTCSGSSWNYNILNSVDCGTYNTAGSGTYCNSNELRTKTWSWAYKCSNGDNQKPEAVCAFDKSISSETDTLSQNCDAGYDGSYCNAAGNIEQRDYKCFGATSAGMPAETDSYSPPADFVEKDKRRIDKGRGIVEEFSATIIHSTSAAESLPYCGYDTASTTACVIGCTYLSGTAVCKGVDLKSTFTAPSAMIGDKINITVNYTSKSYSGNTKFAVDLTGLTDSEQAFTTAVIANADSSVVLQYTIPYTADALPDMQYRVRVYDAAGNLLSTLSSGKISIEGFVDITKVSTADEYTTGSSAKVSLDYVSYGIDKDVKFKLDIGTCKTMDYASCNAREQNYQVCRSEEVCMSEPIFSIMATKEKVPIREPEPIIYKPIITLPVHKCKFETRCYGDIVKLDNKCYTCTDFAKEVSYELALDVDKGANSFELDMPLPSNMSEGSYAVLVQVFNDKDKLFDSMTSSPFITSKIFPTTGAIGFYPTAGDGDSSGKTGGALKTIAIGIAVTAAIASIAAFSISVVKSSRGGTDYLSELNKSIGKTTDVFSKVVKDRSEDMKEKTGPVFTPITPPKIGAPRSDYSGVQQPMGDYAGTVTAPGQYDDSKYKGHGSPPAIPPYTSLPGYHRPGMSQDDPAPGTNPLPDDGGDNNDAGYYGGTPLPNSFWEPSEETDADAFFNENGYSGVTGFIAHLKDWLEEPLHAIEGAPGSLGWQVKFALDTIVGFLDGAAQMIDGLIYLAKSLFTDPVGTISALFGAIWDAATHPVETINGVINYFKEEVDDGHPGRAVGKAIFEIAAFVVTPAKIAEATGLGGKLSKMSGLLRAGALLSKATKLATYYSKILNIAKSELLNMFNQLEKMDYALAARLEKLVRIKGSENWVSEMYTSKLNPRNLNGIIGEIDNVEFWQAAKFTVTKVSYMANVVIPDKYLSRFKPGQFISKNTVQMQIDAFVTKGGVKYIVEKKAWTNLEFKTLDSLKDFERQIIKYKYRAVTDKAKAIINIDKSLLMKDYSALSQEMREQIGRIKTLLENEYTAQIIEGKWVFVSK
ncbi:MAG: hypothetical protein PHC66_04675 [Candidatus Nanoarchaeia archaeon]|nr:hypothetical protein [Candidatus Nanoarchaeia archaeon]MDD5239478.1 hypothetical protein [Candidatus Nanoarchaeia archaeon]